MNDIIKTMNFTNLTIYATIFLHKAQEKGGDML